RPQGLRRLATGDRSQGRSGLCRAPPENPRDARHGSVRTEDADHPGERQGPGQWPCVHAAARVLPPSATAERGDNMGVDRNGAPRSDVEKFCNSVAAATPMPRDWLLSETLVTQKGTHKRWRDDELDALALRFGVSPEAVLRRPLILGRTTQAFYDGK